MTIFQQRRRSRRRSGVTLWGAVATTSLLTLTACSAVSGGAGEDTKSASGKDSAVVTDAMGPVTKVDAPTEAFTPPTSKHILIMPCGSAGQGCVNEAAEEQKVAESLGWKVDVIDGKMDPTAWNQTVKQAVASGVDGIIATAADPNLYAEAMQEVAAKDIPFVLTQQTPGKKDVKGIDTYISPDPEVGAADVAEWIKADSGGKGHVLLLGAPAFANVQQRTAAIAENLRRDCKDCVVYRADITATTMGTSLAPLVTSQLQQNPEINYVWGTDDCCVSFMQQGIGQAGKSDSVKLMSMTGFPQQMAQLKTGEMAFELASPTPYAAWLAVDSLARLMADQPVEKFQVLPQRIWTKENIGDAPADVLKNGWDVESDYRSMFHKLWGMEK